MEHRLTTGRTDLSSFDFVTEAFFLTHYCLHVGLVRSPRRTLFFSFSSLLPANRSSVRCLVLLAQVRSCAMYTSYVQSMGRLKKQMTDLENTMPQWQRVPLPLPLFSFN
jgi:hypothetical protein